MITLVIKEEGLWYTRTLRKELPRVPVKGERFVGDGFELTVVSVQWRYDGDVRIRCSIEIQDFDHPISEVIVAEGFTPS